MSLRSFETLALLLGKHVCVKDSNLDKARCTMLFRASSVWSRPLLFFRWSRRDCNTFTHKKFPGAWRELIQHWVHVCVHLLYFHFHAEGADKVWRLLWKTSQQCYKLSKRILNSLFDHRGASFCLPEHRPDSLHTAASRIFSPSLSESARCY